MTGSYVGTRVWVAFRVDIIAEGITIVGTPDTVAPLTDIEPLDRARTHWRAYPIEDHVADKVLGIIEPHESGPSTRYQDLIDLVAIRTRCVVKASDARQALLSESSRRGVPLPTHFDVPDHRLWTRGYAAEARRTVGLPAPTLDAALQAARPFLDPLLDGTASGTWSPDPATGHDPCWRV
jgi:Nucleotidyl transferase AbiEii toxin, Type IV TA system